LFTSAQQQFQFFPVHNRHQLTPQTGTLWSQVQLDLLEVLDPQELAVQVVQEVEEELVQLEKPVQLGQHSSLYWSVQELQQSTHQTRFPSQLLDSM
jgi:hypothetical protein